MKIVIKCIIILILGLGSFIKVSAQASVQGSALAKWTAKFGASKSFIENKGQFKTGTSTSLKSEPVLFAVDNGSTMIYFTAKGINYTFLKTFKKDEKEEEREKERDKNKEWTAKEWMEKETEERKLNFKVDEVAMFWLNSNPNVEVVPSEIKSDYHSYTFNNESGVKINSNNISGYKKITYKNLYPNIDVEYTFHKEAGIKYAIILHPGADPSVIKMDYSKALSIKENADLHISTKFGDIIDHAPLTFYGNNNNSIISSKFIKKGKTVSFELGNYDNTQKVIIDPWQLTPAFNTNWDCIWECEKDGAGNVYTIGGVMPLVLQKYNSAGALQWSYNTPYDTTSWLGTFATDLAGNSYVTNGTSPGIIKVNTAGALQWTVGGGGLIEYWNIAFNCDQTKLIVAGTSSLKGAIFDINTSNGAVTATKIVAYGSATAFPPNIQEVRSITPCKNGKYYFLTLDSIGYINQNFSLCTAGTTLYKTTNSYSLSYKCENFRHSNTGIMAIRANANFVYTQNGTNVHKRSLVTGAILATAVIPGGASVASFGQNQVGNSGIDLDDCGNVYIGSSNAVIKYDANLNLLSQVATPYKVFDVNVSTAGDVIICGATGTSATGTRTGYIQSLNMTACVPMTQICCDATICSAGPFCTSAAAVTLQAATAGGVWSGTGITNTATGVFNPTTAGSGTHTIKYTLACGADSIVIVVSPCATLSVCLQGNGSITVSNGVGPYTWANWVTGTSSPITNQTQCQACGYTWFGFPLNQCLNGGSPVTTCSTAAGWSNFATGTNTTLPGGATLIKITDASGTVITFTPGTIPSCTTTSCPTLTMAITSQTNVNCFGVNTGSATVSTSGGVGPYTYTWSPGSLNGASQTSLGAGTYTIAIKDANLCAGTGIVTITQPTAALSAVISATAATGCGASTGGATVTASGGTSSYTYSWTPNGGSTAGVSNLPAGSSTVTVTDAKGCIKTQTVNITAAGGPTLSVVSQASVNCFGANTGTATVNSTGGTGPYTYTWSPGNLSGASQTSLTAGTYTVNVQDVNLCSGITTLTIAQPSTALSAIISATTAAGCGSSSVTVFWTEDFGAGCNQGSLASAYTGTNGAWALTATGTNDPEANQFFVSAMENGNAAGVCGSSCGADRSLHVSNVAVAALGLAADQGAAYNAGGFCGTFFCVATDRRAESPVINCTGQSNITLNFNYLEFGDGTNDDASLFYFNGAVWAPLFNLSKTLCCGGATCTGSLQALWTSYNIVLPASANNNPNVKIGYRWINNDDGVGTDPSFAVDDITLSSSSGGALGGATVTASGGTPTYTYNWSPAGGTTAGVSNLGAGSNTVTVTDVKGCTTTAIANITSIGGPTLSVVSQASVNCFGANTGTATMNPTGGTGPYTYTWSPGNLSGAIQSSLAGGTYTINVKDVNLCSGTTTLTITQPTAALNGIISASTNISCGGTTGGATVTASGGTPSYTYSWIPNGGSTAGVSNLSAGSSTVTITDAKGCVKTQTVNITTSGGTTLSVVSQQSVNCFGANTGSATVSPTGGTGPYTYTWTPGNLSGAIQSSLTAGNYTVNVLDVNLCSGTTTLTITQPTSAINAVISATTTTGCGASTGGATVTASGGTPTYTYNWSPSGGTTAGVSNLGIGGNTVTVTDIKGCTVTAVANITTASGPTLSVSSQTNVNCFSANTGTATVNAIGGTGPYTYSWSPGNLTGASQSILSAGTYTINVTDANLCAGTGTLLITQPTASLSGLFSNTISPGCGLSNGSASITASGGTSSYTYSWSPNGGATSSVSNLSSGANSVIITDSKGCAVTVTLSLNSIGGPTLSVSSQTNINCFGASTGTATVNGTGGTGPYTYTWSPGNLTGATQTSLSAGVYTINIKDANLCSGTGTISITQPVTALSAFVSNSPTGCGTSVGSATVTPAGGTTSYSYSWSPTGGNAVTASNLAAGNYSVTVSDAKGCQILAITTISTTGGGPTLSVTSQSNLLCNASATGAATISASGTAGPYTYTWSPIGGNASVATGLVAGTYTVLVKDASTCVSTITVSLSEPSAITLTLTANPETCGSADGNATINAIGGNGVLTPLWNTGSNNSSITGLSSGAYSVTVTDANGCSTSSTCVVGLSGSLSVNAGLGSTIYAGESTILTGVVPGGSSVIWNPPSSLSCSTCPVTNASPSVTTVYTLTATFNGCSGSDTVTVFVDIQCGELFVPTAFSPNEDGQNDVLYVMGNCIEGLEFAIFDRWGEKVFETTDPTVGWDGTLNGKKMTPAAFAYYLKATVKGEAVKLNGSISIVK